MIARIRLILPLVVALAAGRAAAQTVEGTLREPGGAPVERVLVALVDSGGTQVARTLTGAGGGYTLRAPGPGRYAVRAERIGYAAVTSPRFTLAAGETRTERLVASGQAVMLQGLTVTPAARRCQVRPGAGLATATLWEEARKALSATAYGQSARLYRYDVNQWTREVDPGDNTVRHEDRVTGTSVSDLPYKSLAPAELSAKGFVQKAEGDSTAYWAPDAAVMLSEEFVNDHCLRVVEGSDPALIGLAFQPVRGRRVSDIRGTLWLDRRSSELRRVEFGYEGGPPESDDRRAGGTVEYERVEGGPWIVRRWTIRMPQVRAENVYRIGYDVRDRSGMTRRTNIVLSAVIEAGGEVTRVLGGDGRPLFAARGGPVIRGVVWDSTRSAPAAGAQVYLSGTQATTVAGPDGAYLLQAPGEGRYTLAFSVPHLGPLGSTGRAVPVALGAGDTATVALGLPGWPAAIHALCADTSLRRQPAVVMGRVTGPNAEQATVTGSWFTRGYTARSVSFDRSLVATRPDGNGFYVLCGVPTQTVVTVRAQAGTARGQGEIHTHTGLASRVDVEMRETTALERGTGTTERQLAAPPASPAAPGSTTPASGRIATFELAAVDAAGQPLAGATVRIGPLPAVETDAQGHARLPLLPPGQFPVWMMDATQTAHLGRVTIAAGFAGITVRIAEAGRLVVTTR